MVRGDQHTLDEVKPMGVESLDAGIQFQRVAPFGPSQSHEPVKHRLAVAFGTVLLVGDQVVSAN